MKDLVDAIVILRDYGLIHYEISPDNIFIINGYIKLGAFDKIFDAVTALPLIT